MSNFEYKVVPFIGVTKGSANGAEVASQLQAAITQHAVNGWIFHSFNKVSIEVQPGCLSGLLGAKIASSELDQLIFVKAN